MDHTTILSECEIRSLLARERYYRDSSQWDKLRDAYHPDDSKTWIDISWYQGHVDGFVRGSEKQASRGLTVIHSINPVEIVIRGSKALAVSVVTILSRFERGGAQYDLTSWTRLVSRLERLDSPDGAAAWKLLTLDCIYLHDGIQPVVPQDVPHTLDLDTMKTARSSYRYLTWHITQLGLEIRDDLPGVDDEQSVREVMDRNRRWFEGD